MSEHSEPRVATKKRETKETSVLVDIDLDGVGSAEVSTGLPFFDHMLDQLARHGGFGQRPRAGLALPLDGCDHVVGHGPAATLARSMSPARAGRCRLLR